MSRPASSAAARSPLTTVHVIFGKVAWLGILTAAVATLLGLGAPLFPLLDLINQFRLYLVLAAAALVAIAWLTGARRACWGSAIVLAVNAALFLAPLIFAPATAPQGSLRITTFNVWGRNPSAAEAARFIQLTGADIVMMEEVEPRLRAALVAALAPAYPHAVSCPEANCRLLLLSKRAPVASGSSDRTANAPPMLWARFSNGEGRAFTVTGVHLARPTEADRQTQQIDFLVRRFSQSEGTQIVAGDFNLTPFSWQLNRLSAGANLRRHATFGVSWPAFLPVPALLLDNLLATPDVRSAGVAIAGQSYGSDHRPVTFDLSFQ